MTNPNCHNFPQGKGQTTTRNRRKNRVSLGIYIMKDRDRYRWKDTRLSPFFSCQPWVGIHNCNRQIRASSVHSAWRYVSSVFVCSNPRGSLLIDSLPNVRPPHKRFRPWTLATAMQSRRQQAIANDNSLTRVEN